MRIDSCLKDSAALFRATRALSTGGRAPLTYPTTATRDVVKVRRMTVKTIDLTRAEQEANEITDAFYFKSTEDVQRDDKFVIGSEAFYVRRRMRPSEPVYQKWLAELIIKGA